LGWECLMGRAGFGTACGKIKVEAFYFFCGLKMCWYPEPPLGHRAAAARNAIIYRQSCAARFSCSCSLALLDMAVAKLLTFDERETPSLRRGRTQNSHLESFHITLRSCLFVLNYAERIFQSVEC
jgi:hypothetical protein